MSNYNATPRSKSLLSIFRHIPYHLAHTGRADSETSVTASAVTLCVTQLKAYAFDMAKWVHVSKPSGKMPVVNDVTVTLESLTRTIHLIDQIVHSDLTSIQHGWTWSYLRRPIFRCYIWNFPAHLSIRPETVWNTAVVQLSEDGKSSPGLRHLFTLVTLALANLRRVELTLYEFDEKWPVVIGTSNAIYTLRRTAQILAQWMVFQSYCAAEQDECAARKLLTEDNFLYPTLLTPAHSRPDVIPPIDGIFLFDKYLWDHHHPIYISLALLLCFVIGVWSLSTPM